MSGLNSHLDPDSFPSCVFSSNEETMNVDPASITPEHSPVPPGSISAHTPSRSLFSSSVPTTSASATTSAATTSTDPPIQTQILTKPRLQELVREIDPTEQLDEEVEELLLQMADDFVENTVNAACLLAKHRKSAKVEVRDVQLHLERNWNMWIPGFGTDELRPYKRATVTEAHKQRLALIRKAIKKY